MRKRVHVYLRKTPLFLSVFWYNQKTANDDIAKEGELEEISGVLNSRTTASDGQAYNVVKKEEG